MVRESVLGQGGRAPYRSPSESLSALLHGKCQNYAGSSRKTPVGVIQGSPQAA